MIRPANHIRGGGDKTGRSWYNAGVISSQANNPRRMQMGVKLYW
jgi:hypothetical protein